MRKLIPVLIGSSLAVGVALATAPPKVTICHATSSETNPWVRIVVSENAIGGHFDNPGSPKAGHEDDILLQGEQDCPTTPPDDDTPGGGQGGSGPDEIPEVVTPPNGEIPTVGATGL